MEFLILIPVTDQLDFKLQSIKVDLQGCYIILEATCIMLQYQDVWY